MAAIADHLTLEAHAFAEQRVSAVGVLALLATSLLNADEGYKDDP